MIYSPEQDSYLMSEVLKKQIPSILEKDSELRFLEIGCGSGIQLQKAKQLGIKNIFSCDVGYEAVEHCKKLGFNCIVSNLFEKIKGKYNLIIFNPPYLPEYEKEDVESKLITTGGKKGSEIINKFLKSAKKHLTKDGRIFLLTSSLTKEINWLNWKKKIVAKKKLFFERLVVWELTS